MHSWNCSLRYTLTYFWLLFFIHFLKKPNLFTINSLIFWHKTCFFSSDPPKRCFLMMKTQKTIRPFSSLLVSGFLLCLTPSCSTYKIQNDTLTKDSQDLHKQKDESLSTAHDLFSATIALIAPLAGSEK